MTRPEASPTLPRFLPPLLAFLLVAGLGYLLLKPAPQAGAGSPLVGQSAPSFTLKSLDGQTVDLAALKGQPVVLNFWASWCVPCQQEAPLLGELGGRQAGKFRVVGVLFQETSQQNARQFIASHKLNYPNLVDPKLDAAIAYGVAGIPETVFIDAQGVVRAIDRGGLTRERLNQGLQTIGVEPL